MMNRCGGGGDPHDELVWDPHDELVWGMGVTLMMKWCGYGSDPHDEQVWVMGVAFMMTMRSKY